MIQWECEEFLPAFVLQQGWFGCANKSSLNPKKSYTPKLILNADQFVGVVLPIAKPAGSTEFSKTNIFLTQLQVSGWGGDNCPWENAVRLRNITQYVKKILKDVSGSSSVVLLLLELTVDFLSLYCTTQDYIYYMHTYAQYTYRHTHFIYVCIFVQSKMCVYIWLHN